LFVAPPANWDQHCQTEGAEQSRRSGNISIISNEWRAHMKKLLAAIAAVVALTFAMPNSVYAGASASAPSKYAQANRSGVKQAAHQTYPISEYSSSARRNKH
jgi:hypothetical protein